MEFIKRKRETDPPVKDKRIRINVGGTCFETFSSTLERITGTRLALLSVLGESDDAWDQEQKEFFFDRHPGAFASILHYYRTEELHTDQNLCGNIIQGVGGNCHVIVYRIPDWNFRVAESRARKCFSIRQLACDNLTVFRTGRLLL